MIARIVKACIVISCDIEFVRILRCDVKYFSVFLCTCSYDSLGIIKPCIVIVLDMLNTHAPCHGTLDLHFMLH